MHLIQVLSHLVTIIICNRQHMILCPQNLILSIVPTVCVVIRTTRITCNISKLSTHLVTVTSTHLTTIHKHVQKNRRINIVYLTNTTDNRIHSVSNIDTFCMLPHHTIIQSEYTLVMITLQHAIDTNNTKRIEVE